MRSLKLIRKTIISAVTDWLTKNTIIEGDHLKDPDSGVNHPKETAPAGNVGASNTGDLGSNATNDEFGFNSLRTNSRSHCPERTSNVEASVDEILSFYTNKVSSGVNCKEAEVICCFLTSYVFCWVVEYLHDPLSFLLRYSVRKLFQFPMDEDSRYEGNVVDNLQVGEV